MLVPMRAILEAADKNGYAQGAFNVNAVCQIKAAVDIHTIFRTSGSRACERIYGRKNRFHEFGY